MSKYVRTEHGIFELDEFGCIRHPANGMRIHKSYIKDYRVADTIEELCDYFVVEYTFGDHTIFRHFCDLERHYELYTQDYHHVAGRYGAIWVAGKGLIYVAKMNEKGELKLI